MVRTSTSELRGDTIQATTMLLSRSKMASRPQTHRGSLSAPGLVPSLLFDFLTVVGARAQTSVLSSSAVPFAPSSPLGLVPLNSVHRLMTLSCAPSLPGP